MLQPKKVKFKYLFEESYLAYIKNSVGTQMFRNFYVIDELGKRKDVLQDGNLSCAVFVTTIARNFGLIEKLHFTVGKSVGDMLRSGWKKVKVNQLKPGDVLIWIDQKGKDGAHNHIGFYLGKKVAVSNNEKKKMVTTHDYKFDGKRDIELALRPNWKKADAKK